MSAIMYYTVLCNRCGCKYIQLYRLKYSKNVLSSTPLDLGGHGISRRILHFSRVSLTTDVRFNYYEILLTLQHKGGE